MQTSRPLNARIASGTRVHRGMSTGANLLLAGTVCVMAAVALFMLASEPGRPASTVSRPASAVVDTPPASATTPDDLDPSWVCVVGSDDAGPGTPTVMAEMLASRGIDCTPAQGADTEPRRAD